MKVYVLHGTEWWYEDSCQPVVIGIYLTLKDALKAECEFVEPVYPEIPKGVHTELRITEVEAPAEVGYNEGF